MNVVSNGRSMLSVRSVGCRVLVSLAIASIVVTACNKKDSARKDESQRVPANVEALSPDQLRKRAKAFFGELPTQMDAKDKEITDARVSLGRMLYFDKRLSKSQEISCNTCHLLDKYGVDTEKTSPGHKAQRGDRNSPTVYNAALHIAQFWDGRAKDVEEQAKGPVLNPVEMAMADEGSVEKVLRSIPGYLKMFEAAYGPASGGAELITYDRMAEAIGAFERKLVTPAPFDKFLAGDDSALSVDAQKGLALFMEVGCTTCHSGAAVGGGMYQKLGLIKPYPTQDPGRFAVTQNESDRGVFKVPGLRNVEKTGPYFHDGSVDTLERAIEIMSEHQTARGKLKAEETQYIVAFLKSLTGELPAQYIQEPQLPESGPDTPVGDPN